MNLKNSPSQVSRFLVWSRHFKLVAHSVNACGSCKQNAMQLNLTCLNHMATKNWQYWWLFCFPNTW